MEPQNNPIEATNNEPVALIHKSPAVNPTLLIAGVALVVVLGVVGIFAFKPSDMQKPTDTTPVAAVTPSTTVNNQAEVPQQELPNLPERATTPAPLFTKLDSNMLSPNVVAGEVGKRFLSTFTSHIPTGGSLPLTVTVKRAAKYYPVSLSRYGAATALVFFPSCFEHDCFNGKGDKPVSVDEGNAVVAVDLELKNSSANTLYLQASALARFLVDGEYKIPKGSHVTTNITTGYPERFTDAPSDYLGPNDTQTFTFWVEVPHDTTALTFEYGRQVYDDSLPTNVRYGSAPIFNDKQLSLEIPLTFTNITGEAATTTATR